MKLFKALLAPIAALLLTFTLGAGSASAQQGTYCSASTTDGVWALSYGVNNVFYQCNQVRNAIAFSTRAPILNTTRGYYWLYAWNYVQVSCLGGNAYFNGIGGQPLANAFNYARSYNGQSCVFGVN